MDLVTFTHILLESGFALFCVLAAIYIQRYDVVLHRIRRVITAGLLINAVINIADSLAYFYHGDVSRAGYIMVRLSNFVVFAGMFVLLAAGCMLLDTVLEERGGGEDKRLRNIVYGMCAAGILLLVVSRLFGFLYGFDEGNVYHRKGGFVLIVLLAVAAIALLIVRTVRERSTFNRNEYISFLCLWLLPALGSVSQLLFYGISLSNLANSIALLLILGVFVKDAIAGMSIRKSFILTAESIESISEEIETFLEKVSTERQNRIRIRFTIEEALINIWEHFGELSMVRVIAGVKFGKPTIRIDHEGEAFNPFSKTGATRDDWSSGLLASAGISPTYSYTHGNNTIKIGLGRMHINPVVTVLIAILFGIIVGNVALIALSPADGLFVAENLLVPIYDLWNNMLYSMAAPAMLIIVMSTMLDTRDVSEQGGNAGLITGRYFGISLLVGLVTLAAAVLMQGHAFNSDNFDRNLVADLLRKLFSIIPANLLDPFIDFNSAQLIMLGMVIAYAIMAVGQPASGIASLIHQLNMISTQLAQWIAELMPLFTIFLTAQLMLEHNAGLLLGLLIILPFALVISIICIAVNLLYVSRKMQVSPGLLLRKLWPSFMLTLRTGMVADSYALAENCCRKDLGIQKIFTQRVLSLGLILYMPASIIGMISFILYAAVRSNIVITPVWMLTAIIFSLILLVAAPPIPGINLLSYVVIIGQLGIGKEYVIAAMIFDILFNLFASAANQMMLQMDLILQADRVGLLNRKKLAAWPAEA